MRRKAAAGLLLAALVALGCDRECAAQTPEPPHPAMLIIGNGANLVSVAIGNQYREKRNVPSANGLTLSIPLGDAKLGNSVQETIATKAAFDSELRLPGSRRLAIPQPGSPPRWNP